MRRQPVTVYLVGANVAVFVVMVLTGVSPLQPNTQQLLRWGADFGPLSLGPQPWRMLAANYLHIGIIHLFFNMWCLWNLGALAERVFDGWTYFLVYTLSGFGGSLASLWWHPMVIGAGASGAIFGLAGALLAALYLGKLPIPREAIHKTTKSLLLFAAYNLFFGLSAGIDNSAHLGGLLTGFAVGAILAQRLPSSEEVWKSWRNTVLLGTALLLLLAAAYQRSQAHKQTSSVLYFEASSSSSVSFTKSTTWPRIAKICLAPRGGSNVIRGGVLSHSGAGHAESGAAESSGSLASPASTFFSTGLRRPSCATTAYNCLPSSETPQYAM
jgi:rhomboid protease GluP